MIYVLLGMHKSGTTMLSQIFQESGIHMGKFDESKGYDQGNKYECLETHDLNIEILGCDYKAPSLSIFNVVTDIQTVDPKIIAKLKKFIQDSDSKYKEWGFKDPRTCLTYELWKQVLPAHKIVAIYRQPSELWEHYRRQKNRNVLKYVSICWRSLRAWYVYNHELIKALKGVQGQYFLAEYYSFMSDEKVFKKLSEFTGMSLKDSRNSKLYRSKKGAGILFNLMLWVHKTFFSRDIMKLYAELGESAV